ncbi:hypothetical protein Patl1_09405 [Pistacia atlantica]|uniref:Uncharacterized protein n=1 Tax=Pistacia atlantica TaxID=434234 RepID=A0ACC1AJX6_9ROSI|nr:hypothetical protein Patl1_09405 [Pistacia atlantica]
MILDRQIKNITVGDAPHLTFEISNRHVCLPIKPIFDRQKGNGTENRSNKREFTQHKERSRGRTNHPLTKRA